MTTATSGKFSLEIAPLDMGNFQVTFHNVKTGYDEEAALVLLDLGFKLPDEFGVTHEELIKLFFSTFQMMIIDTESRPHGQFGVLHHPTIAIGDRLPELVGTDSERTKCLILLFKTSDYGFRTSDSTVIDKETGEEWTLDKHISKFVRDAIPEVVERVASMAAKSDSFKEFTQTLDLTEESDLLELAKSLLLSSD